MNVSATYVAFFWVVETLIPLNNHEFLISVNFPNNLSVIPVFKKIFDSFVLSDITFSDLTLRLLMSYIYGAPSKARNANVVYIWTYVWQR